MTDLHNALKRSPIGEALKRLIGQHNQSEAGLERWSETLQGVVNPWGLPEWAFLRGERLCGGRVALAAGVATELGQVAVDNPANSGMLVVVESCIVDIPVQGQVLLQMCTSASLAVLTGVTGGANCDTRFANVTEPVAKLRALPFASSALGATIYQNTIPALTPFELMLTPVVLSPGFGVLAVNIDDAAAVRVSYRWRERKAFRGELA